MDIKNPAVLKAKGFLFLFLGVLSGGMLLIQIPTLTAFILFVISVWAFCRFYYFAFYVLHNYADPNFKYAGLLSLMRYFLKQKKG